MAGIGRIFDRPRGSGRNFTIAYYCGGQEQREAVARALDKPPAEVTRQDAERLLRDRLERIGAGYLISASSERLTIGQILDDYQAALELEGRKSLKHIRYHLRPVRAALAHHRAAHLTTARLRQWQGQLVGQGYKPGTINYRMALLRAAFRQAYKEDRLARVPAFPALRCQNARQGFFERPELDAILLRLPSPIDDMARFAHYTGWRSSEIAGLLWSMVDRARGVVTIPDSKNGEPRVIPLTGELAQIIERRWQARKVFLRLSEYVFHRRGQPVRSFLWVWRRACEDAGFPGRLFHDLRRTAVRNFEDSGVARSVAMQITGHRDERVYARYAIVSTQDMAKALSRVQEAKG